MNICIIAMTSDAPIREKQVLLAPYILKRYLLNTLPFEDLNVVVKDFPYDADPLLMAKEIQKFRPDVLVLSLYMWNFVELMRCADLLKKDNKTLVILAGGPMVAFNSQEVLYNHLCLDAVCIDDTKGEVVFSCFVECLIRKNDFGTVPGLAYRGNGGEIIKTKCAHYEITYMEKSSPFVRGDIQLNDPHGYYVTLETSRGCPVQCAYCCWGRRNTIKYFPMERVLKDIEVIYNNPNVKHVLFVDSSMTLNKGRTLKIVEHMSKQKYYAKISSRMHLNIASIDEELAQTLAAIPGFSFDFGLQTTTEKALEIVSPRRAAPSLFRKKIEEMKQWVPDFKFGVDLMVGLPGDSLEGFRKTLDFCLSLEPHRFFIAYPICLLPGTKFYNEKDKLRLTYTQGEIAAVTATETFPAEDIREAVKIATWMQILLYYYPFIAKLYYSTTSGSFDGSRFSSLLAWINALEGRLNLFDGLPLDQCQGNLVKEWYVAKGEILERASSAKAARVIYEVLSKMCSDLVSYDLRQSLELGERVFSYYDSISINPIGQEGVYRVPAEIYRDYSVQEFEDVHSIFKKGL